MENIFGLIIWIFVIFSVINKFIAKFQPDKEKRENSEDIDRKIKEIFKVDFSNQEQDNEEKSVEREEWVPAYEEEPPISEEDLPVKEEELAVEKEKPEPIIKTAENRNKSLEEDEDSKGRNKGLFLNEDDLIKGVIFKEILDEPRARKPFIPSSRYMDKKS